jgi:hypothetical protein
MGQFLDKKFTSYKVWGELKAYLWMVTFSSQSSLLKRECWDIHIWVYSQ